MTDPSPGTGGLNPDPKGPDGPGLCFGCMDRHCRFKRPAGGIKGMPPGALIRGLAALLLPVFSFGAAFLVSGLLFPRLQDPPRAFCGVAALFISALIIYRGTPGRPGGRREIPPA